MNHRELVLSARKKAKFLFLSLPEELQDEVIDGLDSQKLTIEAARDLVRGRGHTIGHDAISGYYRAVRTERRLFEANQELTRILAEYADRPYEDSLQSLANLIIAMAASGLAAGDVGIKDIDLGKVLQALGGRVRGEGSGVRSDQAATGQTAAESGKRVIDQAKIKDLRTQLGL
jgi:hypothetical protein